MNGVTALGINSGANQSDDRSNNYEMGAVFSLSAVNKHMGVQDSFHAKLAPVLIFIDSFKILHTAVFSCLLKRS
jgi:hypothetical protein